MKPVIVPSLWSLQEKLEVYLEATWWLKRVTERLLRLESPEAGYATWLVQRLYAFGEPLSAVVQSVKEADLPELVAVLDHTQLHDPTRTYGEAFRRTASDFHIPVAQWGRGEVQHLVSFINRAHALAEDMMRSLDDPCFCPDDGGEPLPPVEGVDETPPSRTWTEYTRPFAPRISSCRW
jgi:hypothetical protein